MSTTRTLAIPGVADVLRERRTTAVALGLGLILLGLLFTPEIIQAVSVWIASTAYNHCFMVIPIALYMIWDRRDTLYGVAPSPLPLAASLCVPLALMWLFAERLGIMEGRQIAAMGFVEVLFLGVLGWRLWSRLAGPLLYLFFLVPFGDFLTPQLQDVTAWFIRHGLDWLGVPAYIDGYTIEIPEGTFYVAEACAGLRFLIASIAFGALYALLMYRTVGRRIAFVAASIIVPIIANGFRALGIVWLGHLLGSAQAAAADHVLYGWIFFSLVILLLIVLGMPFRQDGQPAPARPPAMAESPAAWRGAVVASLLVAALAAASPAVAFGLDNLGTASLSRVPMLDLGSGCRSLPAPVPAAQNAPGAVTTQRFDCGVVLRVDVEVFSRHATAGPVLAERRRLAAIDAEDLETVWLPTGTGQTRLWRVTRAVQHGPFVAWSIWVDGQPAPGGIGMRAHMAWTSLVGTAYPPVLVTIAPEANWSDLSPAQRSAMEQELAVLLRDADADAQIRRFIGSR